MKASPALEQLAQAAIAEFSQRLGRPPRFVAAAPGRVNLIGEHTDYNDGFVLPMAIARYVVIAADRPLSADTASARVFSTAAEEWATLPLDAAAPPVATPWARYVQGVVAGFLAIGLDPGPFEAVIHSDVPQGGGLSSSAALEVATATFLESITSTRLEPLSKALLCQQAEHRFAGVPCGIMDQIASIFGCDGALLLLDCRSRTVQPTPLDDPDVVALIVNSNVKHALTDGGYAARRRQCEESAHMMGVSALRDVSLEQLEGARDRVGDVRFRRSRHVVSENTRTVEAAEALRRRDWDTVGRLMLASHASLRDDFQVSCGELDLLVDLAMAAGPGAVIGSRMTGGGFGGCTISLVRRGGVDQVIDHIEEGYRKAAGREATVFVTRPVDGAQVLQSPAGDR
jgi:galactokinase